jgi:hypothetical protein
VDERHQDPNDLIGRANPTSLGFLVDDSTYQIRECVGFSTSGKVGCVEPKHVLGRHCFPWGKYHDKPSLSRNEFQQNLPETALEPITVVVTTAVNKRDEPQTRHCL